MIIQEFPCSLGKEVSKQERDCMINEDYTLTYGEVDFTSLGETFATIKAQHGGIPSRGVFYDLGSGTGKGVIAAALLHDFAVCKGIEILKGLYDVSAQLKEEYDTVKGEIRQNYPELFPQLPEVRFEHGSFFDIDWSDASMIFANSTCFSSEMMRHLGNSNVAPGTIALTLTKSFSPGVWDTLASFRKQMSWGEATVFIQRRKAETSENVEIDSD